MKIRVSKPVKVRCSGNCEGCRLWSFCRQDDDVFVQKEQGLDDVNIKPENFVS